MKLRNVSALPVNTEGEEVKWASTLVDENDRCSKTNTLQCVLWF